MKKNSIIFVLCAVCLALLIVVQVSEAEAKKGPRASLDSSTTCALNLDSNDGAFLEVETTLTNKSSGSSIPEVRAGEIEGTYKPQNTPGNVNITFNSALIQDLISLPADVDPNLTILAEFPLCNADGTVIYEVSNARELNGKTSVSYGMSGGEGETRTLINRCTDDPDTLDVYEGGIKLDSETFNMIVDACGGLLNGE